MLDVTRSAAQKLIALGRVQVNQVTALNSNQRVTIGDLVTLEPMEPVQRLPVGEAIPLEILFEDATLMVINKPAGMVVHPGAGNTTGTLVNAVLAHAPEVAEAGDEDRPGVVHRLDKETSGIMLIAKTDAALVNLQSQFRLRSIHKTYFALCVGQFVPARAIINKPIGRNPMSRQRMSILATGREAVTEVAVLATAERHSLVKAFPRTGRTHQVRVHLASLGFPIVGDALYGGLAGARDALAQRLVPRHLLHAVHIEFVHPLTGLSCSFDAEMPGDFSAALSEAGLQAPA